MYKPIQAGKRIVNGHDTSAAVRNSEFLPAIRKLNIVITVVAMFFVVWLVNAMDLHNPKTIENWMNGENHFLLVVSISILLMLICAITPLPAEAVAMANGMIFGPVLGSSITWGAAMIGAYLSFVYSRRFVASLDVNLVEQDKWKKINQWVRRWGLLGFLLARLVPVVPFFALNMGAAFLPISTRNYILITGITILPHIIVICVVADHFAQH